jgi:hypothetical protein
MDRLATVDRSSGLVTASLIDRSIILIRKHPSNVEFSSHIILALYSISTPYLLHIPMTENIIQSSYDDDCHRRDTDNLAEALIQFL